MPGCAYLHHQSSETSKEAHEIPGVHRHNLHVVTADVFCGRAHSWVDRFSCRIHKKFCHPLKDHLNVLRIRLLEVGWRKGHTNVGNTSCDLFIRLQSVSKLSLKCAARF